MEQQRTRSARSGEVAKALGLASATVQSYARAGKVPATRTPGGQYRFNLDEVNEVLGRTEFREQSFESVFDPAVSVLVDDLTAFRPDPIDEAAASRLRIRGADASRVRSEKLTAQAGASSLAALVSSAGSSAVAVLHRPVAT